VRGSSVIAGWVSRDASVAGYDLTKFMVGQRGIFGRLVTLTTRTYRRPAAALLARFGPDIRFLNTLLSSPLRPQWSLLTPDSLFCGYVSDERAIEFYRRGLPQRKLMESRRRSLEEDITHRASLWTPTQFRAAVPPSKISQFIEQAAISKWVADPAFGAIRIFDTANLNKLQTAAEAAGGKVFADSPHLALDGVYNSAEQDILHRLKAAFDPDGKLDTLELK